MYIHPITLVRYDTWGLLRRSLKKSLCYALLLLCNHPSGPASSFHFYSLLMRYMYLTWEGDCLWVLVPPASKHIVWRQTARAVVSPQFGQQPVLNVASLSGWCWVSYAASGLEPSWGFTPLALMRVCQSFVSPAFDVRVPHTLCTCDIHRAWWHCHTPLKWQQLRFNICDADFAWHLQRGFKPPVGRSQYRQQHAPTLHPTALTDTGQIAINKPTNNVPESMALVTHTFICQFWEMTIWQDVCVAHKCIHLHVLHLQWQRQRHRPKYLRTLVLTMSLI